MPGMGLQQDTQRQIQGPLQLDLGENISGKKQPIVKLKAKKKYLGRSRIWGLDFGDRSLGCGGGAG